MCSFDERVSGFSCAGLVRNGPTRRRRILLEAFESRRLLALDFGDAPLPYPTSVIAGGAAHEAIGPTLGEVRDAEPDGRPGPGADGDGMDEDGVTFGPVRVGQLEAQVTVNVGNAPLGARLDAWIDFDGDGNWGGPRERIADGLSVSEGDNPLTFDVPASAVSGATYARFRLSSSGKLPVTGTADDGEVEDHVLTVLAPRTAIGAFVTREITAWAGDPRSVRAADMDGDGDVDLLSAEFDADMVAWYENDSSGGFIRHVISKSANGVKFVLAADLDGDGDMDAVAALDDTIAWYMNDGDQRFVSRLITASVWLADATSVHVEDIDSDGDADVISASRSGTIAWHENDGDGNFTAHPFKWNDGRTYSVHAADLDGDGDVDALSASEGVIAWHENDGRQHFTRRVITDSVRLGSFVTADDLDGDGDLDVLFASSNDDTVAWYENQGGRSFTPHVITNSADGASSAHAEDLDGDGDLDVLSTSARDGMVRWYENDGSRGFTTRGIAAASGAASVQAADLDGDGDIDVICAARYDDTITWYENDGEQGFSPVDVTFGADGVRAVHPADLDDDGDLDLLSASSEDDTIAWYENDGGQGFTRHVITSTAAGAQSVFAADLDGDGDLDVLSASWDDATIAWYENDGGRSFAARIVTNTAVGAASVYAADVDGDGDQDVLSASSSDDTVAWYENDGAGVFARRDITSAADGSRSVHAADLDGDGDLDILSASYHDDTVAWYENDGRQGFVARVITDVADGASSVHSADLDGDGDLDVLSASRRDGTIGWFENDGNQAFTARVIVSGARSPRTARAADVDGDGDLDVVAAALFDDALAWFENDGGGEFVTRRLPVSSYDFDFLGYSSAHAVDVDGDGDLDFVSATSVRDTVAWHENLSRAEFGDAPSPYPTTFSSDGAHHVAVGPMLGPRRDAETDGLPSADADGDSFDDGVVLLPVFVGQVDARLSVHVQDAPDGARLDAWIDFGGDGWWNLEDRVATNRPVVDGVNSIAFVVPSSAMVGATYARFRLSTDGELEPIGAAADGEVEDYRLTILSTPGDFGDAPAPFPTSAANHGAFHLHTGPRLGVSRDAEDDVVPSDDAQADGEDEDGVTFGQVRVGQVDAEATLTVRDAPPGGARLDAWIDFDGDGNWGGADERIAHNVPVFDGENTLRFDVPGSAPPGETYARFRLSTSGNLPYYGGARDGEVEDYRLTIAPPLSGYQVFSTREMVEYFQAYAVHAADVDGDGDTDIVAAAGASVEWYENDGREVFRRRVITQTSGRTYSVLPVDVDGDGDQDVLSATDSSDSIAWHENDGDGNFATRRLTPGLNRAVSVHAGDLDGDGDTDVLAASREDDTITWYENEGDGFSAPRVISATAVSANTVYAVDLDGDGDVDALAAASSGDALAWYENDGEGNFATHRLLDSEDGASAVIADDVDGDGDMDVLAALSPAKTIVWLENDGNQVFTLREIAIKWFVESIRAEDVDGDGDRDVLAASRVNDEISWYENDGNGGFTPHTITDSADGASFVFAADVDRDGDIDVLSATDRGDPPAWYENDGSEQFTTHLLTTYTSVDWVDAADLDGDGDLDVLAGKHLDGRVILLENDRDRGFVPRGLETPDTGMSFLRAADLDSDGDLDLISASRYQGMIAWHENVGSFEFVLHEIRAYNENYISLHAADLDHDGDVDILAATYYAIRWYQNDGLGNFKRGTATSTPALNTFQPTDLDGDGDLDLLITSSHDEISWYENEGDRNFERHRIDFYAARSVHAADLDGDGDVDVISADRRDDSITLYENDGEENFTPRHVSWRKEGDTTVHVADLDGDGDLDVLSASRYLDAISWHEHDGNLGFTTHQLTTSAGRTRALLPVDLDGDGDLDVLRAGAPIDWLENLNELEFGDAPDSYPTRFADGGAHHVPVGPRLGARRDAEAQAQPSGAADGDGDDDDGVTFHAIVAGRPDATLTVNVQDAPGGARLDAWIDFEADGMWNHPLEQIADGMQVVEGDNTIEFVVPGWAAEGTTFARFRLSAEGDLDVSGGASDGEVEDYQVTVLPFDGPADFGDAPAPFPTRLADNGALHLPFGPTLGALRDLEFDGATPDEDDGADEDGVRFDEVVVGTLDARVTVTARNVTQATLLDAWIDFDGDGNWGGRHERIADAVVVFEGDNTITFDVPSDAKSGVADARFRLSTTGHLAPFGAAMDGEVEDYRVTIMPPAPAAGIFQPHVVSTTSSQYVFVQSADLDGDGDMDVVSASYDLTIAWHENIDGDEFVTHQIGASASRKSAVYAMDLDGDGDIDVIPTVSTGWYRNSGQGIFDFRGFLPSGKWSSPWYPADLDGDGDMDLITFSSSSASLNWHENNGQELFVTHAIDAPHGIESIHATDLDSDGDVDLIAESAEDGSIAWYENDGRQQFVARQLFDEPGNSLLVADLDSDGDLDIARSATEDDWSISWYENKGGLLFQRHLLTRAGRYCDALRAGDVDGDGDLDLLCGSSYLETVNYFENDGNSHFHSRVVTAAIVNVDSVHAADLDGDGDLDVLTASRSSETITWYENQNAWGVAGRVWDDQDADGLRAADESGVPDVTVRLLDATTSVVGATVTNRFGDYRFRGVQGGTYSLEFVPPAGIEFSPPSQGDDDSLDSDVDPVTGRTDSIDVRFGRHVSRDAGLHGRLSDTRIAGVVWNDGDGDGIRDPGETGLPDVEVALRDGDLTPVAVDTTDADGGYEFFVSTSGYYSVELVMPEGHTPSPMNRGDDDRSDSDANRGTGRTVPFFLLAGQSDSLHDIGLYGGPFSTDVAGSLRITEVMFRDPQYVELRNIGTEPLDVTGVAITDGVEFVLDDEHVSHLFPGESVVVVRNREEFVLAYDDQELTVVGEFAGELDGEGERLVLLDLDGLTISTVFYRSDWFALTRGPHGFSLTVRDESSAAANPVDRSDWRPASLPGGSPAADDPRLTPDPGTVVINEVMANSVNRLSWIELHNTGDSPIDIGDWYLGDRNSLTRHRIADGTVIDGGGYLVLEDDREFDFSPTGADELHLTAGSAEGLWGYSESVFPDRAWPGESSGPYGPDFVALRGPTKGGPNAPPRVGPVVINEIMYRPDGDGDEFVELYNLGAASVDVSSWYVTGLDYRFPSNTLLPGGGHSLIVPIDPEEFRVKYGIADDVPIFGPFGGTLDDEGEEVRLGPGSVVSDRVAFEVQAPWPDVAITNGSLERVDPLWYGNDPLSWRASSASGGTPGRPHSVLRPVTVLAVETNGALADPPDLPSGHQPSSWTKQSSELRDIVIEFSRFVDVTPADLRLVNLGVDAPNDDDQIIALTQGQLTLDGRELTVRFAPGELSAGVYSLVVLSTVVDQAGHSLDGDGDGIGGDAFEIVGEAGNGFHVLPGDFNGDGGVSVFDFPTLAYWFGRSIQVAPEYLDLNRDGGVSLFDFALFSRNFGRFVTFPGQAVGGTSNRGVPVGVPSGVSRSSVGPDPGLESIEHPLERPQQLPRTGGDRRRESSRHSTKGPELERPANEPESDLERVLDEIGADVLSGWSNRLPSASRR